jgi:protein TonB
VLALHLMGVWALTHIVPARVVVPPQVVMATILPKTRVEPPPLVPRFNPVQPPGVTIPVPLIPQIRAEPPAPTITARVAPPAPPPSALQGKAGPMPSSTYLAQLMAHLAAAKRYPYESGTHARGTVKVRFIANRAGHVLSCTVVATSGTRALDQAACDLFRRADPLPAVPGDYPGDLLDLVLPISYTYVVR